MATTDENIATLEDALATGTLEVRFSDGRSVKYHSPAEIERALAYFKQQKRAAAGRGAVNVSVGAFYRG